jgi:hypothetical protein
MPSNTRNIIIFLGIGMILTSIYLFFFKGEPQANLVTSSALPVENTQSAMVNGAQDVLAQNFLSLLLNIKNVKLDDSIFSDRAFANLKDSTIILIPDGSDGRPNPFAQFGSESSETQTSTPPPAGAAATTTTPTTQ